MARRPKTAGNISCGDDNNNNKNNNNNKQNISKKQPAALIFLGVAKASSDMGEQDQAAMEVSPQ